MSKNNSKYVEELKEARSFINKVRTINEAMTFDEEYDTMANGEPLMAVGMFTAEGAMNIQGAIGFMGTAMGVPCIMLSFMFGSSDVALLYWTADGLSTEQPSSGK